MSTFPERARAGRVTESKFAARMVEAGLGVVVPPLRIRPSYEDREAYGDGGADVEVVGPHGKAARVNVKGRREEYRSIDDWPWSRWDPFVCEARYFDPSLIYALVSNPGGGCMIVHPSVRRHLGTVTKRDSVRGWDCKWLTCPRRYVRDVSAFVDWMLK